MVDEELDDDEIDLLMLTAQGHDLEDESKRAHASEFRPVSSQPASRILFAKAKPEGARIVLAERARIVLGKENTCQEDLQGKGGYYSDE